MALDLVHDLDRAQGDADIEALLACDAIHLSGGSTSGFLARLKRTGMLAKLRNWALDGGLLVGPSAGAILMTPTIAVDALFGGGRPDDAEAAEALDLLPFEFFPHLWSKPSYLPDLLAYSARNRRPIVACPDGDGVVVSDGFAECVGDLLRLSGGVADSLSGQRFRC
jgi:dipeptidase E